MKQNIMIIDNVCCTESVYGMMTDTAHIVH